MRIAHLIPTLSGGGAERQLRYLSEELGRRGHDVLVLYVNPGVEPWSDAGVAMERLRTNGAWDPRLLTQVASRLRAWKPHVVHTWILQMDIIGGINAGLMGIPWVLREPTTGVFYRRSAKAAVRALLVRTAAAAIVANSIGGLRYWEQHAPKRPRFLIPNAVPVPQIDAVHPLPMRARAGLFAGRLEASKNVDILMVASREAGLDLTICGDGPERARLQQLAGEGVHFVGHRPDVWAYMKSAAFVASLSAFEGRPNVVLEAFAARVPVILSDIPAHRDIADDRCAWFVQERDTAGVAQAMREILAGGAQVQERVSEARRRVEDDSVESMVGAFEAIYDLVLRGKS